MKKIETIMVGDSVRLIISAENPDENYKESLILNISVGGRCCFHGELSVGDITTNDIKQISDAFLKLSEQIKNNS